MTRENLLLTAYDRLADVRREITRLLPDPAKTTRVRELEALQQRLVRRITKLEGP